MRRVALAFLIAGLGISGCGGGGSLGSLGFARLFATDDLNVGYDHVWVTVKRVVLHGSAGDVVAYNDATGLVVDLRTLRDATGARFRLLGDAPIAAGTYTGIDVTLGQNLSIFTTGATTATAATFGGANGTDAVISQTFTPPAVVAAGGELVIDFNLANWNLNNGVVTAPNGFIVKGDPTGIEDPTRHEKDDFSGTISGLTGTAPAQTFTLGNLTVETTASTVVYQSSGATTPVLANAENVEVRGVVNATTGHLVADSVRINVGGETPHAPRVEGTVTAFDATAGSVTVTLHDADGFLPGAKTVVIATNGATAFFGASGETVNQTTFFAAVANGLEVLATGTYDATSGTLTATKLKLSGGEGREGENGGGNGNDHSHHDAQVSGRVLAFDGTADTISVAAGDWEGINVAKGAPVSVLVTGNTRIQGAASLTALFAALTVGTPLEVQGSYDVNTHVLTAGQISLNN